MLCPDLFFPFPSLLPCLSFTSFFPFSSSHSHLSFLFSSLSSPLFLASFLPPTLHPSLILSLCPFFFSVFRSSALWRHLCFRPMLRSNALTAVSAAGFSQSGLSAQPYGAASPPVILSLGRRVGSGGPPVPGPLAGGHMAWECEFCWASSSNRHEQQHHGDHICEIQPVHCSSASDAFMTNSGICKGSLSLHPHEEGTVYPL